MKTLQEQETAAILEMGEKIKSLETEVARLTEVIRQQTALIKELS